MKKLFLLIICGLVVIFTVAKIYSYSVKNHVYLEYGYKGKDVVIVKSFFGINPVDDNFDANLQEKVIKWQKKFNSQSKNEVKADGKIRKNDLSRMKISVDDNYKKLFRYAIIKDEQYYKLYGKAYTLGYEGYTNVAKYILKRVVDVPLKVERYGVTIYDIKVDIDGQKYIDNNGYATEESIYNALYKNKYNAIDSRLLRIFPEEENYKNYIKFSTEMKQNPYRIDNLDKVFLRRLGAFLKDNKKVVTFAEGFRTSLDQESLYRISPSRAVPPGTSWHEYGVALDIQSTNLGGCQWLKNLYNIEPTNNQSELLKYGIFKPYTKGNKKELLNNNFSSDDNIIAEDWHLQPIETRYEPNQSNYMVKGIAE